MSWAQEQRREPRLLCHGEVRLTYNDGAAHEVVGKMLDVSNSGFRAVHGDLSLQRGTEVEFNHPIFRGKARVAWTRSVYERVESGFSVVRD